MFVGGRGDAGEGADFGVGDSGVFERVRGRGQGAELAADADPFAGGAGFDVRDELVLVTAPRGCDSTESPTPGSSGAFPVGQGEGCSRAPLD